MLGMLNDVLATLGMSFGLFGTSPVTTSTPHIELLPGSGQTIASGQRLTVHLLVCDGTGREYTNTKKRGLPYSFRYDEAATDPMGQWVVGMRVGGQRRVMLSAEAGAVFSQIVPSNTPLVVVVTVLRASDR